MTYREQFDSAMACKTTKEADAWMAKEIQRYWDTWKIDAEKAHETILHNLGYMAGYYDDSMAKRVRDLFGAKHPIFGDKKPTAEEALEAGKQLARGGR